MHLFFLFPPSHLLLGFAWLFSFVLKISCSYSSFSRLIWFFNLSLTLKKIFFNYSYPAPNAVSYSFTSLMKECSKLCRNPVVHFGSLVQLVVALTFFSWWGILAETLVIDRYLCVYVHYQRFKRAMSLKTRMTWSIPYQCNTTKVRMLIVLWWKIEQLDTIL